MPAQPAPITSTSCFASTVKDATESAREAAGTRPGGPRTLAPTDRATRCRADSRTASASVGRSRTLAPVTAPTCAAAVRQLGLRPRATAFGGSPRVATPPSGTGDLAGGAVRRSAHVEVRPGDRAPRVPVDDLGTPSYPVAPGPARRLRGLPGLWRPAAASGVHDGRHGRCRPLASDPVDASAERRQPAVSRGAAPVDRTRRSRRR